ncbi:cellulose biosynthesis cyclic di-GMP-binding regulatory protein BcsB [Paraburkholderia silvatlantica]|uniref:cellulose biosynthesis cyclic di-GMP-binding regulatory protein BcsB n=1 Tax=Paraburkholderia silvatlantica TaxID=321895 RepID=UPI0011B5ABC4|nr:cellulose biosynthesis cyclic di-GMP-binding regulatory protein BcsB [Paraburkholderia silvatlantica]
MRIQQRFLYFCEPVFRGEPIIFFCCEAFDLRAFVRAGYPFPNDANRRAADFACCTSVCALRKASAQSSSL